MVIAYKHVPWRFARAFASGMSIQLGTFAYYREMESPRADNLEGAIRLHARAINVSADSPPPPNLVNIIGETGQGQVNFNDCVFELNLPPAYLFCTSSEPDVALISKGQVCFKISDLHQLSYLLTKTDTRLNNFEYGKVSYEEREFDAEIEKIVSPDPFKKRPEFEWEKEIRVVWPIIDNADFRLKSTIQVSCPEVAKLITPVP